MNTVRGRSMLRLAALFSSVFLLGRILWLCVAHVSTNAAFSLYDMTGYIVRAIFGASGFAEYSWIAFNMAVLARGPNGAGSTVYADVVAEMEGITLYIKLALLVLSVLATVVLLIYALSRNYVTSVAYRSCALIGAIVTCVAFAGLSFSRGHVDPLIWLMMFMVSYVVTIALLVCSPLIFRQTQTTP